jgi:hypothetical protein
MMVLESLKQTALKAEVTRIMLYQFISQTIWLDVMQICYGP